MNLIKEQKMVELCGHVKYVRKKLYNQEITYVTIMDKMYLKIQQQVNQKQQ